MWPQGQQAWRRSRGHGAWRLGEVFVDDEPGRPMLAWAGLASRGLRLAVALAAATDADGVFAHGVFAHGVDAQDLEPMAGELRPLVRRADGPADDPSPSSDGREGQGWW